MENGKELQAECGTIHIADAIVHPTRLVGWTPETMSAGIQGPDGQFLPQTRLTRVFQDGSRYATLDPAPVVQVADSHARGLYAGILDHRFGHFLLESLSRLHDRDHAPDYPLIWSARADQATHGFLPWQAELLSILGVAGPHVFVVEPCHVGDLRLSVPGYVIQHEFTAPQRSFLAKVPWRPEPGRRTWLSRGIQSRRFLPGMAEFEERLASEGWTIIAPETLSVSEQLAIYARSERIAGPVGSAFHALILMRDAEGLPVDLFVPEPYGSEERMNQNYVTIARAKGFAQRTHFIPHAQMIAAQGINAARFGSMLSDCLFSA